METENTNICYDLPKISEEQKKAIKNMGVFALPDSPAAYGMKAGAVKPKFWKPLVEGDSSLVGLINAMIETLNTILKDVQGKQSLAVSKIEKTSSKGLVDTYTITFLSGKTSTFTLRNGADGITPWIGIDPITYEWKFSYDEGVNWTSTNVIAKGEQGDKGDPFLISKTFASVAEMHASANTDGVLVGQYVAIDTNVEDPDSAKIFLKTETGYQFVVDLSGKEGIQGPNGADGHTPVKGTDYWTDADKQEIVDEVIAGIPSDDGVSDVQLNGATIVDENGVAIIPVVTATSGGIGLLRVGNLANGQMGVRNINGVIALAYPEASINGFTQRKAQGSQYSGVVDSQNFDLAVKVAMTDGIGEAWTEKEQAAARTRIGAVSMEEVLAAIKTAMSAGAYTADGTFLNREYTWDELVQNGDSVEFIEPCFKDDTLRLYARGYDVVIPDTVPETTEVTCLRVVFPATTVTIEDGSSLIEEIYIKAIAPPTLSGQFGSPLVGNSLKKIVVPYGCADAYKSATGWCNYAEYIFEGEMPI